MRIYRAHAQIIFMASSAGTTSTAMADLEDIEPVTAPRILLENYGKC